MPKYLPLSSVSRPRNYFFIRAVKKIALVLFTPTFHTGVQIHTGVQKTCRLPAGLFPAYLEIFSAFYRLFRAIADGAMAGRLFRVGARQNTALRTLAHRAVKLYSFILILP